jgi:ABC-type Na+ efflux pump permease subunit
VSGCWFSSVKNQEETKEASDVEQKKGTENSKDPTAIVRSLVAFFMYCLIFSLFSF